MKVRKKTDVRFSVKALNCSEDECNSSSNCPCFLTLVWDDDRACNSQSGTAGDSVFSTEPQRGTVSSECPQLSSSRQSLSSRLLFVWQVEEVFTLTLEHLCQAQNRGYTHFRTGDRFGYTLPVFLGPRHRVWGLTAVALDQALALIVPADLWPLQPQFRPWSSSSRLSSGFRVSDCLTSCLSLYNWHWMYFWDLALWVLLWSSEPRWLF